MDAPLCQKIPGCGKRHFGDCGTVQEAAKPKDARPKKKSKAATAESKLVTQDWLAELLARIESLEARVLELESRKKYMREYQRDRRAEKNPEKKI